MPPSSPSRRRARDRNSKATADPTPICVFQRLLIVHFKLPDICIDGGLDEGASLEELSENILYYHVDDSIQNDANDTASDAIQFAGLCSALLSLPEAVAGSDYSTDETRLVHLDSCTLVFVPLEHEPGIMAIAQVKRQCPADHHASNYNASPLAVRKSIETCHELFCLLRGDIHHHLRQACAPEMHHGRRTTIPTPNNGVQSTLMNILLLNYDDTKQSIYPGMTELYSIRKQARKLKRDLTRSTNALEQHELTESIEQLDQRLGVLAKTLPIHALRTQLKTHYEEYILNKSLIASSANNTGMLLHCCLVENVPTPIDMSADALTSDAPPAGSSTLHLKCLNDAVQNLLDEATRECVSNGPLLVGISMFRNGELFSSAHTSLQGGTLLLSSQTAYLLMEYMASYRAKISLHAKQHSGLPLINNKTREPSPKRIGSGLRRFLSSSFIDEDTTATMDPADVSTIMNENIDEEPAHFLSPPPLSMLNVSDQVLQVKLPSHGSVWTPKVYLPMEKNGADTLEANLVLLDIGEYSFLLYLRPSESAENDGVVSLKPSPLLPDANEEKTAESTPEQGASLASSAVIMIPAYSRLLEKIAFDLASAVARTRDDGLSEGVDAIEKERSNPFAESGEHVVFIDRNTQRVVLYSNGKVGDEKGSAQRGLNSMDASSGFDCRHVLASNLPPNVVEAFDDLMHQVNERMAGSNNTEEALQLCTYLSQGWVFAHAQERKELYIFFDASKFVTVSDVQHAADRVRTELFNDSIK